MSDKQPGYPGAQPEDAAVLAAYEAFPAAVRQKLLDVREILLATAANTPGVGEIEETLKWGEPAYLTHRPKSGSTIRLGHPPKPQPHVRIFNRYFCAAGGNLTWTLCS